MSLYTPGDDTGSFIIDADMSYIRGEPLRETGHGSQDLDLEITVGEGQLTLRHTIAINSSSIELDFPLHSLAPHSRPYSVTLKATRPNCDRAYTATTQVYHLPKRADGGSVTKVDSLYGGLLVQNKSDDSSPWSPLLPYSFYVSWDGWLKKSLSNVQKFKDQGYNIIHIVPNAGLANQAFNFTELNMFLDKCDEVGLWVMYDMRWTYQNLTSVRDQVNMLKTRKSMLLWYTGDEPDGQGDPLNATRVTYDLIKSLDPWHPVSLCLNCFNFYYEEYSSGADIILSDVYPIAVNTSWSEVYGTPCNTTYGCCGCDDCEGTLDDISVRLDRFVEYQTWIGTGPKSIWGVPMAFGNESFWSRYPTAAEEVTMTMLSVNHNAKGIVMWDYPTTTELERVTSQLSRVLASEEVVRFLLGAPTVALQATGPSKMDVASWRLGTQMVVSILSLQTPAWLSNVSVTLPEGARAVHKVLWGSGDWRLIEGQLVKTGGRGLETDLVIVEFDADQ
ncbi:uncharacterized protein N7482_007023 [Penicillium canariense]|uniref:Glycoside hydrolase subgroup catalytic core n=1 Tax=Penicillium canariense TaxID=189055 RepID=A0A9W9HVY0_9EURO|nr:uncharacterized protein N7482_007023 [Penicillium canariense]KAJ5160019.1 hypothetical protein N7482_007023 [Penicillium canariense]